MRTTLHCLTLLFALVVSACPLAVGAAQEAPTNKSADEDVMMFFYRDPRPERLLGFLERFDKEDYSWASHPPLAGFFGAVFGRHPEWIDRLVPAAPSGRLAETLRAAVRLSHRDVPEQVAERLAVISSDATLKAELEGLPSNLREIVITRPTHLDILWGAAFASGDKLYAQMIFQFFAAIADRSVDIALDVSAVAAQMWGADNGAIQKLPSKYDDGTLREMVFAASALWSLVANARQHTFVHEVLSEAAKNAKVSKGSDGSLHIEGSIAGWIAGALLSKGR